MTIVNSARVISNHLPVIYGVIKEVAFAKLFLLVGSFTLIACLFFTGCGGNSNRKQNSDKLFHLFDFLNTSTNPAPK